MLVERCGVEFGNEAVEDVEHAADKRRVGCGCSWGQVLMVLGLDVGGHSVWICRALAWTWVDGLRLCSVVNVEGYNC